MALFRRHPRRDLPFEVDPRRVNATIGAIAFLLPVALIMLAALSQTTCFMSSISHFYYTRLGGDILVGALSVVGAVMVLFYVYKGDKGPDNPAHNRLNALLAKAAGFAALGVAYFPTSGVGCRYTDTAETEVARFLVSDTGYAPETGITGTLSADFWASLSSYASPEDVPFILANAHYLSAAAMFAILAYFALAVFTRVQTPHATMEHRLDGTCTHTKRTRNRVYKVLGGIIVAAMLMLGMKMALVTWVLDPEAATAFAATWNDLRMTFWCEAAGLMAFGASWALKGRLFGLMADAD